MGTRMANRASAARRTGTAEAAPAEKTIQLQLPRKMGFLLDCYPYKIAYGGRGSLKSWSFARALLVLGVHQDLRILCAREVQKSLAQSVHRLLVDQIQALDLGDHYDVTEKAIRGQKRDTLFQFTGLSDQTAESIKSFEGVDVLWLEEAQAISRRSFQIALPTVFRNKGAEVWCSFNPELQTDEVWERFIVHPPEGAVVVEMNWRDAEACGWHTAEMERLRQYDLAHFPNDYPTIWEGEPRTVVAGAIYATEIVEMIKEGRARSIPYDPRLPVDRIWDLGWADSMAVVMVQKPHPSALNVINYLEDNRLTYANMIAAMDRLNYKWGTDWLPHDALSHHPTSGTNAKTVLQGLGCKVQIVPRSDPEARIKAARMMFPRLYVDNSKHDTPPDRPDRLLGAGYLMDRLKRYKRHIPTTTGEPASPVHDAACLGPDTLIRTLSGWKRIADLVGKRFHVWGYSEVERRIVPARAMRCWETKTADIVAKVTLDTGAVITCTVDHRFMRRDGSWVEAQNLQPRDSLMPLYESNMRNGHPRLELTDGTVADEHRYAYSRLVGHLVDGQHIHHRDNDKHNNEPDNLVQLTPAQHCSLHSSTPEHLAHLRRISNRKGSKAATDILIETNKLRAGDNHHTRSPEYWTPDRRSVTGAAFKRNYQITERPKDCLSCGGTFIGNYKRCYCCSGCKNRDKNRKILPESKWRTLRAANIHKPDCRLVAPNNHRVVAVEIVRETMPVYDIEVEGIHNFAAEGVILHNSHGSDAFGALAEIVDRIRNEGDRPPPSVRPFANADPGMGMLG